jgi:hypothetical protein
MLIETLILLGKNFNKKHKCFKNKGKSYYISFNL